MIRSVGVMLFLAGCALVDEEPGTGPGGKGDGHGTRLDLNDVSILFPLPASEAARDQFLWLAPRTGEAGPYFPWSTVDDLPRLIADFPITLTYPNAMITGMRYDPCAPNAMGGCEAQLRLVAQPVLVDGTSVRMLEDSAIHLFYRLDSARSRDVVRALVASRDLSPVSTSGRLRVHPGLGRPDSGALAAALRTLVVEHCREETLFRITLNTFAFDNWGFFKFDYADGVVTRENLGNMVTDGSVQGWIRQAFVDDTNDPSGKIDPAPLHPMPYLLSIQNFASGAPKDPVAARAAAAALLRIENPDATITDEVDCVSCHVATPARRFAERHGVEFATLPQFDAPAGYDTSLVLAPEVDGNLGNTIAFGWHHMTTDEVFPSINQRVINESAKIADRLSRDVVPNL
ncbi:MAG: hypothetical protein M3619_21765 [Myxococcota bacterium]|nr:hypothetical protein [Myxococcota bacterium]